MDSRLIFRHRPSSLSQRGTQEGRTSVSNGHGTFPILERIGKSGGATQNDSPEPMLSRKARWFEDERPYRKPTLVGKGKSPKVFERTLAKELGKLTP